MSQLLRLRRASLSLAIRSNGSRRPSGPVIGGRAKRGSVAGTAGVKPLSMRAFTSQWPRARAASRTLSSSACTRVLSTSVSLSKASGAPVLSASHST